MGPDTIWILVPLAGISIPIAAIWFNHRQKVAAMERGIILDHKGRPISSVNDNAASKAEVEELRERVRVLERNVTDSGYNLASEIESLRNVRLPKDEGSGVPLDMDKERA